MILGRAPPGPDPADAGDGVCGLVAGVFAGKVTEHLVLKSVEVDQRVIGGLGPVDRTEGQCPHRASTQPGEHLQRCWLLDAVSAHVAAKDQSTPRIGQRVGEEAREMFGLPPDESARSVGVAMPQRGEFDAARKVLVGVFHERVGSSLRDTSDHPGAAGTLPHDVDGAHCRPRRRVG